MLCASVWGASVWRASVLRGVWCAWCKLLPLVLYYTIISFYNCNAYHHGAARVLYHPPSCNLTSHFSIIFLLFNIQTQFSKVRYNVLDAGGSIHHVWSSRGLADVDEVPLLLL